MANGRVGSREHFDVQAIVEVFREAQAGRIPGVAPGRVVDADQLARSTGLDPELAQLLANGGLPDGFGELSNNDLAALLNRRLRQNPELLTSQRGSDLGLLGSRNALAAVFPPATPRQIRDAERWLTRLGYNPGTVDGQTTAATTASLRQFQAALGIGGDGELTPQTLRRLESTARRVRENGRGYLTPGMKGREVRRLQARLERLGDFQGTPDGIYGQSTADAVEKFRDRHDLNQGVRSWGPRAQRALNGELDNIAHDPYRTRERAPRNKRAIERRVRADARNGGIGPGSTREVIKYVQRHLKAAGYNPNREDGVWDDHTQAMVNQFQRRSGIAETERIGVGTWRRLSGATLDTNNPHDPVQRIGERSNEVRRTERRLRQAGYNPGEVDGVYTAATERAADRLRRRFGIRGTNGVGRRTAKLITRRIEQREEAQLAAQIPFYRELDPKLQRAARIAVRMGLTVTSTTHGGHSPGSHHFPHNNSDGQGHAIDVAVPGSARFEPRLARFVRRMERENPVELFYDHLRDHPSPGRDHFDHAHVAIF